MNFYFINTIVGCLEYPVFSVFILYSFPGFRKMIQQINDMSGNRVIIL